MYFKVTHKQTRELLRLANNTLGESTVITDAFFWGYFTEDGHLYYGVKGKPQFYITERGGEVQEIGWEEFNESILEEGKVLEKYTYKDLDDLYIKNEEGYSGKGLSTREEIADKIYRWHNQLVERLEGGTYNRDYVGELEVNAGKAIYSEIGHQMYAEPFEVPHGSYWYQWPEVKGEINLDKKVACAYCGESDKARNMALSGNVFEENINRWMVGQFVVCLKCQSKYEGMFGETFVRE